MQHVLRSREFSSGAAVVFATLFAIGFVPLFGGPGYEHSLASGLVVPCVSAIAAACRVERASAAALAAGRGPPSMLAAVGEGALLGAGFALIALSTALLHVLRTTACDVQGGVFHFLLTAGMGAGYGGVLGGLVGWVEAARGAGVIGREMEARAAGAPTSASTTTTTSTSATGFTRLRRFRRARLVLFAIAAPLAGVVVSIGRFFGSPMIFAFDPFFGYFSGTLYDTVIDAGPALLTYRCGTVVTLAGISLFASCVPPRALRLEHLGQALRQSPAIRTRFALALVCFGGATAMALAGPAFGHYQTSASIAKDLGASLEGPRCTVIYPLTSASAAALLLQDCEEEIAAVERALGVSGTPRITAFFFRDAGDKRRLMGAESTYIAKPWRREVYVQLGGYPHPVLGHELAHVIAGSFGRGPFRIAGDFGGLLPNPGLIEGIAVAASPDDDELTDVQWSRAMLDVGILPPISSLFSLQFLGAASSKSYTVAGAFVRFLMETHGAAPVRAWYSGKTPLAAFGKSLNDLDNDFRAFLKLTKLPDSAVRYAKAKFDRKGVFSRTCPHIVDALRREADACRENRQSARAIDLYGQALARDPKDFASRLGRAIARGREALRAPASEPGNVGRAELTAMAEDTSVPETFRDRAAEALADLDVMAGSEAAGMQGSSTSTSAMEAYRELSSKSVDEDAARTLEVKELALATPEGRKAIVDLLLGTPARPPDSALGFLDLGVWWRAFGGVLPGYLIGKNLAQRAYFDDASRYLQGAASAGPLTPRIGRELLRQRAIVACASGDAAAIASLLSLAADEKGPFGGSAGGRKASVVSLLNRCRKSPDAR